MIASGAGEPRWTRYLPLPLGPASLWSGVDPAQWPQVAVTVLRDALYLLGFEPLAGLVALAVGQRRAGRSVAAAGVALRVLSVLRRARSRPPHARGPELTLHACLSGSWRARTWPARS